MYIIIQQNVCLHRFHVECRKRSKILTNFISLTVVYIIKLHGVHYNASTFFSIYMQVYACTRVCAKQRVSYKHVHTYLRSLKNQ